MQLSIVTLGHVHAEDLAPLTTRFTRLEQLVLDIHPRVAVGEHRSEFNRAVDAATGDWILVMRERETIDEALGGEIFDAITATKAWGFRIRSEPIYSGKPLRLTRGDGEIRLFHRRHLLRRGEVAVQGTVIRIASPLRSVTFESGEAHRQYLEKNAVPHSALRRMLLFAHYAIGARASDANTLRYLWIEAGFDSSGV